MGRRWITRTMRSSRRARKTERVRSTRAVKASPVTQAMKGKTQPGIEGHGYAMAMAGEVLMSTPERTTMMASSRFNQPGAVRPCHPS